VVERDAGISNLALTTTTVAARVLPHEADSDVEPWTDHDGAEFAYFYSANRAHWMHFPDVATFRLPTDESGVTAMVEPKVSQVLVVDAFQRYVLPMTLYLAGKEVLHASAVLGPRGVVAACALSQTGKSTVGYGLGRRGYPLWADDAVVFDVSRHSVTALPLPFRMRLRPPAVHGFLRGRPRPVSRRLG